jgi:DNA-binding HxlR family transcriptional regulator
VNWLEISAENCSVGRTLELIGEKWTLLLIRDAANGVRRFDDFHRHVGLSEPVLADRLRKLVAAGIFGTRPYQEPGRRARNEYRLTAKGWQLFPILISLMQWGDEHLAGEAGAPWVVRHKGCGHPVQAVVQCTHDHVTLMPRDTVAAPGPGALAQARPGRSAMTAAPIGPRPAARSRAAGPARPSPAGR